MGKVALTRAYGQRDVEADLLVTPATQFVICSITKSFTATAIASLHHEGRLDWAKPVRDYMPEFRLSDGVATDRITVRDLLSHQSGLPRHDWVHLPGDRAPAEMRDLMRHLELSRDIRAAWQYNNLGYNIAGLLIERLSGQSFEAFIRTRLTDRLGMTVGFNLDDLEASSEAARPYMMHEDTRLPAMRLPSEQRRPVRSTPLSLTSQTGCCCIWVKVRSAACVYCQPHWSKNCRRRVSTIRRRATPSSARRTMALASSRTAIAVTGSYFMVAAGPAGGLG
jgi:CubicO group peptidase (beta-lactamase class C family)